jgi:hypothetical protein
VTSDARQVHSRRDVALSRRSITAARTPARPAGRAIPRARARDWGWLPALTLLSAIGVLLVALAHSAARADLPWAQHLYWTAAIVLFTPAATRIILPGVSRQETIGLVLMIALAAYFIKLLQSPLGYTFFDEFLHWRTARDIIVSGRLFSENSLLPVSPLYPGLEIVATAIVSLTGLSIFEAGVVVVGVARIVMMLALFRFFERIGGSTRLAGVAAALYMGNPHFVIFDAQFAYESLALAFSLSILQALLARKQAVGGDRVGVTLVAVVAICALMATHHATSYMTSLFLVLWAAVTTLANRLFHAGSPGLIWAAAIALAVNITWLLTVSSITIGYLAPHLSGAMESVLSLIAGEGSDRELFKSSSGIVTPLLEKIVGLAGPGLIMICLPMGLWSFWLMQRKRVDAWVLALGALSYPVTLVLRMTGGGWEISARSSVFVFVPLVFILATGIEYLRLPWFLDRLGPLLARFRVLIFVPFAALIFCGGIIAGWSPWARMPWPYMAGADTRSVEPQGLAAAAWAVEALGPNNRMAADRVNLTMMGTYGEQRLITHLIDKVSISGIFLAGHIGPNEEAALRDARIRYLVVDRRISRMQSLSAHYYETWEQMIAPYDGTPRLQVLEKFDHIDGVSRVFDSGDILIYDVGTLSHAPEPH